MKKFLSLVLAAVMLLGIASSLAEGEKVKLTMWCIATESDSNRPAYEAAIVASIGVAETAVIEICSKFVKAE